MKIVFFRYVLITNVCLINRIIRLGGLDMLDILSFSGDSIWEHRIRAESNHCDSNHIYVITYAVAQLVLSELSPCDLDGNSKLTIDLNIEQDMHGKPGYNCDKFFKVSFYNLDRETSLSLYQYKKYDLEFQREIANLLFDILVEIDRENQNRAGLADKRAAIFERLEKTHFYKEIPLDQLSKKSRNRAYKAVLYQCIGQEIGEGIRCDLYNCKTNEVIKSEWITPIPGYINRPHLIKKTMWDGNEFKVVWKGAREDTSVAVI